MRKIRGQEYDGAANMSGAYGGVQAVAYRGGSGGDSPRAALWDGQQKRKKRKRKKKKNRKKGKKEKGKKREKEIWKKQSCNYSKT